MYSNKYRVFLTKEKTTGSFRSRHMAENVMKAFIKEYPKCYIQRLICGEWKKIA